MQKIIALNISVLKIDTLASLIFNKRSFPYNSLKYESLIPVKDSKPCEIKTNTNNKIGKAAIFKTLLISIFSFLK